MNRKSILIFELKIYFILLVGAKAYIYHAQKKSPERPFMPSLNLPTIDVPIRDEGGKRSILDIFRRKYVALTPEEWVRQHFLHWLLNHKGYPRGLIAVEVTLTYFRLKKRADAIVYDKMGRPLMIIECKSPEIQITQDVFDQVARYNLPFGVLYLAVTNGIQHFCCRMDNIAGEWVFLESVPDFGQLSS